MAILKKIDSNVTGLRYAEEESLGVLPNSGVVWYPLEPNTYADLGGDFKLLARNPINSGRQRQKGVIVDLDAAGGLNQDFVFTEDFIRILQGFFFADIREKAKVEDATAVGSANDWFAKSNAFDSYKAGDLVFAKGYLETGNAGLHVVDTMTDNDTLPVTDDLTAEATPPADVVLHKVGHQFGAGLADIDAGGDLPKLTSSTTFGARVLTITDITNLNTETVTVDGVVYTFKTALTPTAGEVLIGINITAAAANLASAINSGSGAGTTYVATTEQTRVSATSSVGALTVTALVGGAESALIPIAETLTDGAWAGASTVLSAGSGFDVTSLGIVPGEWVYIGDDSNVAYSFTEAVNNGWARVKRAVSATTSYLEFDKTDSTMVDATAGSLTVRIFIARALKNELGTDIVRRTYNLERTLGQPDTSQPTATQAEYLEGAVANELTFNLKTADKLTMDLSFIATDDTQATISDGLKDGERPSLTSGDAFNSSNDFSRLRMVILDPTDSNPTDLFGFLSEFTIAVKNNVSPNKAISVLGAFEVTAGQFTVDGKATAYFSVIEAIAAIRNNSDVSFDFALSKANVGFVVDMPLIALGGGKLNVQQDKEITLPLDMPAAEDRTFHHTLLMNFFEYLPDVAAA